MRNTTDLISTFSGILPEERIIADAAGVDRISKDFYWYSPVLKRQLEDKSGDLAVRATTEKEVAQIIHACAMNGLPLTIRGGGTGNYGQCIPLYGGVMLDLGGFDEILDIDAERGVVRCRPGARLGAIEEAARRVGWELRCYPSTYVKASVAGFLAGGSGGIGSISHGPLRRPGTVVSITVLTVEEIPRRVRYEGSDVMTILHAWGTNGVIVEIELALAPKRDWAQLAVEWPDFESCLSATEELARDDSVRKRLVTTFEPPIVSYFKPLLKYLDGQMHTAFFEVENSQLAAVEARLAATGARISLSLPATGERRKVQLSDYTWNHTTLWAIKADPELTYLQCGFEIDRHREQFSALKGKYGADFLFHLEFARNEGQVTSGGIPIVRFRDDDYLNGMIEFCHSIGVGVANPHVNRLGGGGRWTDTSPVVASKFANDPGGLLNPGKLNGHPLPATVLAVD